MTIYIMQFCVKNKSQENYQICEITYSGKTCLQPQACSVIVLNLLPKKYNYDERKIRLIALIYVSLDILCLALKWL